MNTLYIYIYNLDIHVSYINLSVYIDLIFWQIQSEEKPANMFDVIDRDI